MRAAVNSQSGPGCMASPQTLRNFASDLQEFFFKACDIIVCWISQQNLEIPEADHTCLRKQLVISYAQGW